MSDLRNEIALQDIHPPQTQTTNPFRRSQQPLTEQQLQQETTTSPPPASDIPPTTDPTNPIPTATITDQNALPPPSYTSLHPSPPAPTFQTPPYHPQYHAQNGDLPPPFPTPTHPPLTPSMKKQRKRKRLRNGWLIAGCVILAAVVPFAVVSARGGWER